jgi:hypothetical protein
MNFHHFIRKLYVKSLLQETKNHSLIEICQNIIDISIRLQNLIFLYPQAFQKQFQKCKLDFTIHSNTNFDKLLSMGLNNNHLNNKLVFILIQYLNIKALN